MRLDEYMSFDAEGLATLVSKGEVTATELLTLARERRDQVNPVINAIIGPVDEAEGRAARPTLSGRFAGVPFLIKDLVQDYKGVPTSSGSRSYGRYVPTEHSLIVQRFLDAGLVIFGRTNTPEFGIKNVTEPECWGPARNPWNTAHTPGGSSGGSAAAVAAGIVPAAAGNDGGGSIRTPAACSGLVGLKPSRGLAPYGPQTGELVFGLATHGVLTRTVRDTAGLMDAIVGRSPVAEYDAALPDLPFRDQIEREPDPLRIGFTATSAIAGAPDPEAVTAVESAAALLARLGHRVEEVEPPYDEWALTRDFLTIWFASFASTVARAKQQAGARDKDFEADTLAVAELGRAAGVLRLELALANRNAYVRSLSAFHERYDYFLTPTIARPPLLVGATTASKALHTAARLLHRLRGGKLLQLTGMVDQLISDSIGWAPYTAVANMTGRPAVSVPLHWTASGLPLEVQLLGRLGGDGDLLRVAAQVERAQPWIHRFPAPAEPC
jgi:Asp-tRNA(Asn)/Glu-tRNA(Gln) amidotransferase A subunit family amidase